MELFGTRFLSLPVALVATGLLLASAPARAGTVYFTDGKGMAVEKAWIDDGMIYLELPGGGILGTDPERVARVILSPPDDDENVTGAGPGLDQMIAEVAEHYEVDEKLIRAVIRAESGFDPAALSPVGAVGLMQLMPGTARDMGVQDIEDPQQNLEGGVRYLRWMMDRFGDLNLALAAYNAGPAAVTRYQGVPPFPETQSYVKRVLRYAQR